MVPAREPPDVNGNRIQFQLIIIVPPREPPGVHGNKIPFQLINYATPAGAADCKWKCISIPMDAILPELVL